MFIVYSVNLLHIMLYKTNIQVVYHKNSIYINAEQVVYSNMFYLCTTKLCCSLSNELIIAVFILLFIGSASAALTV